MIIDLCKLTQVSFVSQKGSSRGALVLGGLLSEPFSLHSLWKWMVKRRSLTRNIHFPRGTKCKLDLVPSLQGFSFGSWRAEMQSQSWAFSAPIYIACGNEWLKEKVLLETSPFPVGQSANSTWSHLYRCSHLAAGEQECKAKAEPSQLSFSPILRYGESCRTV